MNKPTKNIILILLIIAILLAAGLFYFWNKYIKNATPPQTTENPSDFPFGSGSGKDTQFPSSASNRSEQGSIGDEAEMPILRQISDKPIAGGIAFDNGSATVIRYVERGTGHIVETASDSFESNKVSNTTIPKVPQAIWTPNGQSVIMRYLKDGAESIYSFSANIVKATTTQDVSKNPKSAFLPLNITQLSINPSGDKIFYLTKDEGGSIGVVSSTDGSKKSQSFQFAITEWLASWPNKDIIVLATKPSSVATGYLFFLNEKTGGNDKILSGINGLTALVSSTTKNILYSESADGSIKLNYYNLKNNQNRTLSFKTLPEKCAWSKIEELTIYCAVPRTIEDGEYPDIWYQGVVSFNDNIWKIDLKTSSSELVYNLQKESGKEFDLMNPFLSGDDEYLFFPNKKYLTFWSLSLKTQLINKTEEGGSFR